MPGTVINIKKANGCSLERTISDTSPNLMSNPVYDPPGCSIGLIIYNKTGTFSYLRNIGIIILF